MEIIKGKIQKAQKVVIYGPEGIGKSTFASQFPDPLFIDTEGSTYHMDVARFPKPTSWAMIKEQVLHIKNNPGICKTIVIDTADWAETLCIEQIIAGAQLKGIEDFGYGKGYTYVAEEFGRFLNALQDITDQGINVVITAHAQMRKFEQPDELGAYDRWELKLGRKSAALIKEWADMLLFANYKILVINVDNQGAAKGKNKAQGGKRVMYTTHHVAWDAKNRHGLADELPFEFSAIAHAIPIIQVTSQPTAPTTPTTPKPDPAPAPVAPATAEKPLMKESEPASTPAPAQMPSESSPVEALQALLDEAMFSQADLRRVVAARGYYTESTPVTKYDPQFITGVLIGAWPQVKEMLIAQRDEDIPF